MATAQLASFFIEREEVAAALQRFLNVHTHTDTDTHTQSHSVSGRATGSGSDVAGGVAESKDSSDTHAAGDGSRDYLAGAEQDRIAAEAAKFICTTLEKYQEQPQLLDAALPGIICPLLARARTHIREWHADRMERSGAGGGALGSSAYEVYHSEYLHLLFMIVYTACKTRGYKTIIRLFPHEVADVEPALHCLVAQDPSRHEAWETRYVLLLWLSILVLVPFHLDTIDSTIAAHAGHAPHDARTASGRRRTGLIETVLRTCKAYLADPGAVRDAGALCLSRLLTRPDMDKLLLEDYMQWATGVLSLCGAPPPASTVRIGTAVAAVPSEMSDDAADAARELLDDVGLVLSGSTRVFLTTGIMQSLVEIAKHGHRDALRECLSDAFDRVVAITDADNMYSEGGEHGHAHARRAVGLRGSPLLRKLTVKLAARTGLTHLPPRVIAWRYQRGHRSLLDNLSQAGVAAAKAKAAELSTGAASMQKPSTPNTLAARPLEDAAEGNIEDADVPFQMDDIIDMLLNGLKDTDTVVRWSAAKGVGRVTGRLPHYLADQVVEAVITLLDPVETDGAWHGGCLALAELARRGLLLPPRLPEVVPLVLQALAYDVRKGAHSVGQHVRDAACYVCWAFARAYAPTVMRPYVTKLAQGMLITALFDREVNCRRAASAAFQENVGRQGHENFPNGIEILTAADYFSLGNRQNAYVNVAPKVAVFAQYRYALLEHLLHVKLKHWDREVRILAAKSLARLAHLDIDWAVNVALAQLIPGTVSPDLFTRHGSTLGVAEIVLAISQVPARLHTDTLDAIRNIVVKAEKARAYTGRGGEMVRAAMCRLIECQCLADHPISRKAALRMLQTVDDCLKHPNDIIQAAALSALRSLTLHALREPEPALVDRIPKTYVQRLNTDENPAVRRGMALALGALPRSLLTGGGMLDEIIAALITASKMERQVIKRDAATRRNAVIGLGDLVLTVGLGRRTLTCVDPVVRAVTNGMVADASKHLSDELRAGLTSQQFERIWSALLSATHDYATDNRGDVGSWVRKVALQALERIVWHVQSLTAQQLYCQTVIAAFRAGGDVDMQTLRAAAFPSLAMHGAWGGTGAIAAPAEAPQKVSGFGITTGYGAGNILISAEPWACPDSPMTNTGMVQGTLVSTAYGEGALEAVSGAGAIAHVRFWPKSAGSVYFPYGVGLIPAQRVMVSRCSHPVAASLVQLQDAPEGFLTPPMVLEMLGAFLRQLGEKLDLLRGVAGEGLSRMLNFMANVPPLPHVSHRSILTRAFPAPATVAHALSTEDSEDLEEDEGADAASTPAETPNEGDADASPAGDEPLAEHTGTGPESDQLSIQWSLPHQAFPRLIPLLSLPEYVPHIVEGIVTSVGGLSESVVKHSASALTAWAADRKAHHDADALHAVLSTMLALCKARPKREWDVLVEGAGSGNAGSAAYATAAVPGADDASMSRWFRTILGSSSGGSGGASAGKSASDTKIDTRLITPALRSMDVLLASGACTELQPPRFDIGSDIVSTLRKRVQTARDDAMRVMSAAAVYLDLLPFNEPVRTQALHALLDLLCHPFPRVRKTTAERFYVRLLTLEDVFTARAADAGEGGYEEALTIVTETAWDAEVPAILPPRDSLYGLLGVAMPSSRSGVDADVFGSATRTVNQERAAAGEDDNSYGNLVREMGY